jgi:DNA invertase Pin-like site-specific DNA recombinase
MMDAIIYTRFSPRSNAEQCTSCEQQEAHCRDYAAKNGLEVVGVFTDKERSGADENRPGLWACVDALKAGMVLLAMKPDRLARDVYLSELIKREVAKRKARIIYSGSDCNGDTPDQVMIRQILQVFAEYERKLIGIRTSLAMKRHMAEGRRMSKQLPYGYMEDPDAPVEPHRKDPEGGTHRHRVVPCPEEEETIEEIARLWRGGLGYRAIGRALTSGGRDFRGGAWHHKTIKTLLERHQGFRLPPLFSH